MGNTHIVDFDGRGGASISSGGWNQCTHGIDAKLGWKVESISYTSPFHMVAAKKVGRARA